MSKVIFLDFDGVICTARSTIAYSSTLLWRHLDPVAVKMIEKLCKNTDAKIVISSTWRYSHDQESINTMLLNAGMSDVPFHQCWKTPRMNTTRGKEIEAWFEHNAAEKYIILDDNSDFELDQEPFFIQTDSNDGFGYHDYLKALELLK